MICKDIFLYIVYLLVVTPPLYKFYNKAYEKNIYGTGTHEININTIAVGHLIIYLQ